MAKKKKLSAMSTESFAAQEVSKEEKLIRIRVLIVCEGTKTEPNYFKSFSKVQKGIFVYDITTEGGGINTDKVVSEAIKHKVKAEAEGNPYDCVWAVFDKDSFPDNKFDTAINNAFDHHIGCAWSNEAFELWYVLHFDNRITPMSRKDYQKVITERVNASGKFKGKYSYRKNDPHERDIMLSCGNEELAIRYAKNLYKNFVNDGVPYHKCNPCTTVYQLVELLSGKDEKFNRMIKEQIEK